MRHNVSVQGYLKRQRKVILSTGGLYGPYVKLDPELLNALVTNGNAA